MIIPGVRAVNKTTSRYLPREYRATHRPQPHVRTCITAQTLSRLKLTGTSSEQHSVAYVSSQSYARISCTHQYARVTDTISVRLESLLISATSGQ